MSDKDYYKALGIPRDASVDEIKKAFRRQAVKHHPDQGGDEAKFKEINEAYEVLSNPEKRQRYDQFGTAGLGGSGGFGRAGASGAEGFRFDFGDGGLGDIFSSFFGAGQTRQGPTSGDDINIILDLDFREAVFGVDKEISLRLDDVCIQCQGQRAQPGSDVQECATCNGSGQHVRIMKTVLGNIRQQAVCPACRGEGRQIKEPCTACHARGVSKQEKKINLTIPAGIDDGATIRLRGSGESNYQGAAGDLYITIQVRPDRHFTREGDLLLSEETITMAQAALGDNIKVATINGEVTMKVPPGTQSGTDFRLEKKGVPRIKGAGRGDQIVRIIVETPTKLNAQQKKILQEFQQSKR